MYIDNFNKKVEGYWKSKQNPKLPMPIPNQLSEQDAIKIHRLIKNKEKSANKTQYRGFSFSRIEPSIIVGSAEFSKDEWNWPDGYADHYVLKHKVKPSAEFLDYIGFI